MKQKKAALETVICIFLLGVVFSHHSPAAEDPEVLYEQGRFAEAEKAYADADMDHPRDIRYRYNRGCAAYQKGDYKGAAAAFSSVLKRAEDNETRFRASYNLGNTAFRQGDFESAAFHYKKALSYKAESEDARHNLELAVREAAKLKEQRNESQSQGGSKGDKDKEGRSGPEQEDQEGDERSKEDPAGEEGSGEPRDHKDQADGKNQDQSQQQAASGQEKKTEGERARRSKEESLQDLSGELKSLTEGPEESEGDQTRSPSVSMMDKKKAEALLDNIKEDRSRFLRFQVPEEKKYGVPSGKDW